MYIQPISKTMRFMATGQSEAKTPLPPTVTEQVLEVLKRMEKRKAPDPLDPAVAVAPDRLSNPNYIHSPHRHQPATEE